MRALLIVDRLFSQHERAMLGRTAIGLLDEGIETVLVVPDRGSFDQEDLGPLVPQIKYKDRGLSFTLKIRAMNIIRELMTDRGLEQWDIIHAYGGQAWPLALELAKALEASLVLELWRAGLISKAAPYHRNASINCLFTAPDRTIADATPSSLPVQITPWGVLAPANPRTILNKEKGISIVFQSSGRNKDQCTAAFDGILDVITANPDIHLFVNLHAARRASLWNRAKNAGALPQLTLVDQIEEQRDLVLNADFLIYPDTVHEHRSFLAEAMANAMCVIAGTQDSSSCIIKGQTAAIVQNPLREQWSKTLSGLIDSPDKAHELSQNAWSHIRNHRKVSTHIGAIIDAYSQLVPVES